MGRWDKCKKIQGRWEMDEQNVRKEQEEKEKRDRENREIGRGKEARGRWQAVPLHWSTRVRVSLEQGGHVLRSRKSLRDSPTGKTQEAPTVSAITTVPAPLCWDFFFFLM